MTSWTCATRCGRTGWRPPAASPARRTTWPAARSHSIREILDRLLALSDAVVEVVFDPTRRRPADIPVLTGDASRFHAATGWQPEIPFERTLVDTLEYWRAAVGR